MWQFSLCFFFLSTAAAEPRVLLDDFEAPTVRVTNPGESEQALQLLWSQYEGDRTAGPDPGEVALSQQDFFDGAQSLRIAVRDGNLYLQFRPVEGNRRLWMRQYVQPPDAWRNDTFNRLRFWLKLPPGIRPADEGRANVQFGTYVRQSAASEAGYEDGGGHYYHLFNIPYTGEWHQIIVDTHPNTARDVPGSTEIGDKEYPTKEAGFNYFDAMTRFYVDVQSALESYPADFYVDGFELYHEDSVVENTEHIYSLHGVYDSANNVVRLGWMRHKDENSTKHEVRYAFDDIHEIGWSSAKPAPRGVVRPLGWQGYNGMEWSGEIDLGGHDRIFMAIKPSASDSFRQIVIPIADSGYRAALGSRRPRGGPKPPPR